MPRLAIANVIALPGGKTKLSAVGYFNVDGTVEAENEVAFCAPVIRHIASRILHHAYADVAKLAGSPQGKASVASVSGKWDFIPIGDRHWEGRHLHSRSIARRFLGIQS